MKFSDDLYQLIQSLSQSEKRYVKLVSKAFTSKGTDKQVALFDAFDKQKKYDEQKIRDDFSEIISAKNFHVAKNRLYNLILKALYLFHSNASNAEKNKQLLFQARVLLNKGLYKQGDALIDKALKSTRANEEFLTTLEGLTIYANSVSNQRDVVKMDALVEENLTEEYETIEAYKTSITYFFLQKKILRLTHKQLIARSEAELEELNELKQHPLLQDPSNVTSDRSRKFYYTLNGFLARYEGNYTDAIQYWSYFIEEYEQSDKNRKEVGEYIKDLNNVMFLQLEAEYLLEAWATCQKMEDLLELDEVKGRKNLQLIIKARVIEFKLEYFIATYQYEIGAVYMNTNAAEIATVCAESDEFRVLVVQHAMSGLYLANGMYETANEMIIRTLESKILKKHPYIHSEVMLLNVLVHFELGNYQLLDSLLLNTYRMLSKRQLLYKTEKIIFKYIRKYLNNKEEAEVLKMFKTVKKELQAAKLDRFEKNALPTFDLIVWIESKIQGKSMVEIITQSGCSLGLDN